MRSLQTYLEELGVGAPTGAATSANTMGMGNPGEIGPDTLTEPIGSICTKKAYCKRQNEKKKKNIKESIFDRDLATRETKFENQLKHTDSDSLQELSIEDRNKFFDQLFEFGKQYMVDEMKKHRIDLKNNLLIIRRDRLKVYFDRQNYPCKYVFMFDAGSDGKEDIKFAVLMDTLSGKHFYWDSSFDLAAKRKILNFGWVGRVSVLNKFYNGVTFSVIDNKKVVNDIIDNIRKD